MHRHPNRWRQQPKDGLILHGGESTVQMRLLSQLGLHDPIREAILGGGYNLEIVQ